MPNYQELPFYDYLVLVENELKVLGLDMMEDERITFKEIAEGQEGGLRPRECAQTIKGRLEYDANNDTEYKDTKG